ncbi:hypothetical protein PFICI_06624 [Pestalotiopsis fici W106-1]|uniref:Uncharacterized protein n=1 Tax=Pestalotiopsis fici (strain W106-1 / CGMCC3.15140) TaxID=1229662 RepID=W3X882_PESFW|nr:uncharacterized protein PFICI_06624 [Pestalotiopsis fici W106-1]ETS81622.1 hypothetical protein PFICI_06624 [Pestalotiopsis fici W106-1]
MAEAFGLAASAAGIVSLGLQVYEGVASYVEGVKDRKTELSAILKQANTLQAIVNALQVAAPRIDAILSIHESPLLPSLKTVEEELWALKLFLGSLQNTDSQPKDVLATLKEQKRKLTFPFHRPTLNKLQKKLESANNALQTSLQVVELTATALFHTAISDIRATVDNSQLLVTNLQSGIGTLETSMNSMALSLAPTQASIGSMEGRLNLLTTEGRNNNENLERNFHTVHTSMSHLSDDVGRAMSTVQMSTGQVHGAVLQQSQDIRQLQDVVSKSIVQPTTIAMAVEAVMEKKFAELTHGSSAPTNLSQPQLILGRLLSKPSELRDAHDVDRMVSITRRQREASIFTAHRSCSCYLKPGTQHQVEKFGDFYMVRKTKTQPQHLPDCDFWAYNSKSTTHERTLSYTGFRKLLSVSLELSLSWTSGAGGLSISPNITLRPMVDETRSPAFRLIDLMRESYFYIDCSDIEFEYILDRSMNAILKLYRTKECSPYDVNFRGESVLHKWIDLLFAVLARTKSEISARILMTALSSTRRLVAGWSPSSILFDYYGQSPLDYTTGYNLVDMFPLGEVATLLCSYDDELAIRVRDSLRPYETMIGPYDLGSNEIHYILGSPVWREVYGLGPLSTSIISGNKDRVQTILDTDVSTLEETSHALQTPFHLAALSPNHELLEVLLEAAEDGSTRFDTRDARGKYALEVAAIDSSRLCLYGRASVLCTDCPCSVPFDMLQSRGWQLSPKTIISPCQLLIRASQAVRMKMISNFKHFREGLRTAALDYLSPYEYQHLQLDDSRIVDGHMKRVVERLLESDLRITQEYEGLVDILSRTSGDCIYHDLVGNIRRHFNIGISSFADLLFDSGFKDVDHEDEYGNSPLQILVTSSESLVRDEDEESLELLVWFIHHGANISQVITESWDVWGATLTANFLCLKSINRYRKSAIDHIAEALRWIAPLGLFDKCRCGCVGAGCSTTTIFFRNLWQWFFRDKDVVHIHYYNDCEGYESSSEGVKEVSSSRAESVSDSYKDDTDDESVCQGYPDPERINGINTENDTSSEWETIGSESAWESENDENGTTDFWQSTHNLSTYLQLLEVDFVKWDHVSLSALKVFTFEALELRHTCCHKLVKSDNEDIPWKWKDVPVCENEIDEIQEEDHELLGLLDDLVEEFVDELQSSGNSLQQFLIRYWAPRMEHVLEDLRAAKMSAEQVLAAEQVGVTWEDDSVDDSVDDSISESEDEYSYPPRPTRSERIEALIKQMDEIVAESSQSGRT